MLSLNTTFRHGSRRQGIGKSRFGRGPRLILFFTTVRSTP